MVYHAIVPGRLSRPVALQHFYAVMPRRKNRVHIEDLVTCAHLLLQAMLLTLAGWC